MSNTDTQSTAACILLYMQMLALVASFLFVTFKKKALYDPSKDKKDSPLENLLGNSQRTNKSSMVQWNDPRMSGGQNAPGFKNGNIAFSETSYSQEQSERNGGAN